MDPVEAYELLINDPDWGWKRKVNDLRAAIETEKGFFSDLKATLEDYKRMVDYLQATVDSVRLENEDLRAHLADAELEGRKLEVTKHENKQLKAADKIKEEKLRAAERKIARLRGELQANREREERFVETMELELHQFQQVESHMRNHRSP